MNMQFSTISCYPTMSSCYLLSACTSLPPINLLTKRKRHCTFWQLSTNPTVPPRYFPGNLAVLPHYSPAYCRYFPCNPVVLPHYFPAHCRYFPRNLIALPRYFQLFSRQEGGRFSVEIKADRTDLKRAEANVSFNISLSFFSYFPPGGKERKKNGKREVEREKLKNG